MFVYVSISFVFSCLSLCIGIAHLHVCFTMQVKFELALIYFVYFVISFRFCSVFAYICSDNNFI
jgi:hypothetical protein